MTCQELTNELLLDYTDWQLPPHERNRIARHLDACEECRTRRDDLEGMAGALRRTEEAPPAALLAQLDRAVLAAVPRTEPAPLGRPKRRFGRIALGAAAVVAVAMIAFILGERAGRGRVPAVAAKVESPPATRIPEPPILKEEPREPEPVRTAPPAVPKVRPETPAPALPPEPRRDPAVEPKPATVVVAETPRTRPLRGDLNGDGVVDIADARILQEMIMQGLPLPEHADVNGDGIVDLADVREILRAELALR